MNKTPRQRRLRNSVRASPASRPAAGSSAPDITATAFREHVLERLVADTNKHGLVLFVGSGINATAVPQWGKLLARLLASSLTEASLEDDRIAAWAGKGSSDRGTWKDASLANWCRANFDVCALASIAKGILGPERFRLEIQEALYSGTPSLQEELERYCKHRPRGLAPKFEFLHVVAQLCSLPQVRAVATFNYDTLLETAIMAVQKKTPWSYHAQTGSMPDVKTSDQQFFPVFHLHGLVSPPDSLLRNVEEAAVLAYDEYFEKNAAPLSWETATPVHLMRNYCTLWLGASLKDWNMLRLLHAARGPGGAPPSYCLLCLEEVDRAKAFVLPKPENGQKPLSPGEFKRQCAAFHRAWNQFKPNKLDFQAAAMRIQATLLERMGTHLVVAGERFSGIPRIVEQSIIKPLRQQ